MSYTGIYGPMQSIEHDRHPRIVDYDRWQELIEIHEWSHIFDKQAVIEEHQEDGYPRRTWDAVVGFRSYEKDIVYSLNIDRIAYGYGDSFGAFWSLVGECLEPFWFIHSGEDSHWPSTDWHDFDDPYPEYCERVYYVEVDDDITVKPGTVEFTGFEGGDS